MKPKDSFPTDKKLPLNMRKNSSFGKMKLKTRKHHTHNDRTALKVVVPFMGW